ncbi:MAG: 50S ribosomal protein L25 [Desulfobacterales bacterium]
MEQIELTAVPRTVRGNGPARRLRQSGQVPAILYGPGSAPRPIAVSARDLEHAFQKGNIGRTIFALNLQNGAGGSHLAVIKELQTHPVTGRFLHVDFYEIDLNRKLRVRIPLVPQGKAKGEELGGMLQIIEREVEVLCLPRQIPDRLEVDVTPLGIGETLHVRDLPLPDGVELPPGVNYTVITIVSPKAEAAPAAPAAEAETPGEEAGAAEKAEEPSDKA